MVVRVPDPSLVVLCGPAGGGETTFAPRPLRGTTIVSSHRCRALIAHDEANNRVSRDALEPLHTLLEVRVRHRRLTVADSTALLPEARRMLRQIARRCEVPVIALLLDVPEATCLVWDERRDRRVGRPVIHRQWERFQQALRTIPKEGFDQVVIVGERELNSTQVQIVNSG